MEVISRTILAPAVSYERALPCSLIFITMFHDVSLHSCRVGCPHSMPANEYKFRVILDFGEATHKNMDARGSIAFLSVLQVQA